MCHYMKGAVATEEKKVKENALLFQSLILMRKDGQKIKRSF